MEANRYHNSLSFRNKFMRFIWTIVYHVFFRTTPNNLFWSWRKLLLKCFGAKLGNGCKIRSTAIIWAPWNFICGDFVAIGSKAIIYSVDKITIGSNVAVSQGAYLCSASHNIYSPKHELTHSPIIIEDRAWVATDAFIGMGVTIGEGAVVGARAAVFKDVEPWTVVGGNPAKFIKKRIIQDA